MRDWLGKVVGGESEDLSRHDKWLCMLYPRVSLLKKFLCDNGVIFVSIDDTELPSLLLLFDEIFGRSNFMGTIIWRNVTDNNPTNISIEHEYVVCYARNKSKVESVWKASSLPIKERLIELGEELKELHPNLEERQEAYTNWFKANKAFMWPFDRYKFIDDGGIFTGSQSVHNPGKEGYRYDVFHPISQKPCVQPLMGYRFPEDTMRKLLADGRILFGKDESKIIELKLYVQDYKAKLASVIDMDTRLGANELRRIFPEEKRIFGFSKPSDFIAELLSFAAPPNSIVLDSFAGSGTTGHSILKLNREDEGNRHFILVEMEPIIAKTITAERLKRVINGYSNVEGLGGGFHFYELGTTLFDVQGKIREDVSFTDLAQHVFFAETGSPLSSLNKGDSPLLGVSKGVGIYLLYNGILKDKTAQGGNVLTRAVLNDLPAFEGPKVIYGTGCLLSEATLQRLGVTFRQIPYEVRVS